MELSEELKAKLSESEDGKKLLEQLAGLEKAAQSADELKKQVEGERAKNASLTERLTDPEFIARIAGAGSPSKGRQSSEEPTGPDVDGMSLKELRAHILKNDVGPLLEAKLSEMQKSYDERVFQVYKTVMAREVDEVKSSEDFPKIKDKILELSKESPSEWPRNLASKARKLLKQEEVAKEKEAADKAAAEKKAQVDLFTEQPEAAIAALVKKDITKEEAVAKAIELSGGLPPE